MSGENTRDVYFLELYLRRNLTRLGLRWLVECIMCTGDEDVYKDDLVQSVVTTLDNVPGNSSPYHRIALFV